MADLPAHPDTGDGPEPGPGLAAPPVGRPAWPVAVGIAFLVVLVVSVVVLHLLGVLGPGDH